MVRHEVDGGPLRPPGQRLPRRGPGRRIQPVPPRGRPLPPLRVTGLPLGPPHPDLPQAEEASKTRSRVDGRALVHGRQGLELQAARTPLPAPPPATGSSGKDFLHQVYTTARIRTTPAGSPCRCSGIKKEATIVSNESAEIIRMLNSAFDELAADADLDFYPEALRAEIDAVNEPSSITERQQRGLQVRASRPSRRPMKKPSSSSSRRARRARRAPRPSQQRYLVGDQRTEADWRLLHHAGALRRGLRRPLQVQPTAHRRLPRISPATCASSTSIPGVAETVSSRAHQAPLLREPRDDQSDGRGARRPGARSRSTSRPSSLNERAADPERHERIETKNDDEDEER